MTRTDVRGGLVAAVTALCIAAAPAVANHIADYARNSNKVDGLDAADLVRVTGSSRTGHLSDFQSAGYATIHRGRVEAPVPGFILAWSNFSAEWDDSSAPGTFATLSARMTLDGRRLAPAQHVEITRSTFSGAQTVALSGAIPVKAGNHRLLVQLKRTDGDALTHIFPRQLETVFVPFGEVTR